jgi:hypothetical protein
MRDLAATRSGAPELNGLRVGFLEIAEEHRYDQKSAATIRPCRAMSNDIAAVRREIREEKIV